MQEQNTSPQPADRSIPLKERAGAAAVDRSAGKAARKSVSKGNLVAIAVIGAVVLVAALGYYFLSQLREKQEGLGGKLQQDTEQMLQMNKQLSALQSQIATLQSKLAGIENDISNRDARIERTLVEYATRQDEKLDAAKAKFDETVVRIQRQLGKTRGDWLIADAEYLLSIANERLQLVGDISTALTAMEGADQRLRESGDPAVFKVREAIAAEMDKLKAVTPPDIVGIFARLQTLSAKTAELALFLPHVGQAHPEARQPEELGTKPEAGSIEELMDSAWQDLKGLVTVRRTDRPVDVVLLPEEVQMIRQQLRSEFGVAKLALVQRNSKLYQSSLENARQWLRENYQKGPRLDAVLAEIDELEGMAVNTVLPDVGGSLKLLRDITKLRIETDKALQKTDESGAAEKKP